MNILCKGDILEAFIGGNPCLKFDIDNSGAVLYVSVFKDMLREFKIGGHYKFSFVRLNNIIFFCAKWGELSWMSAPFSPHLAQDFEDTEYEEGLGMPLTVILIDVEDGEIHKLDFLVLGNEFSNALNKTAVEILKTPFDINAHKQNIKKTYSEYATDKLLVDISEHKYSID